jgi:type IV secretory pathway TraG/TraD family ATPase VirD4
LIEYEWASFVGNSGVTCAFAINDFETADYLSKTLGTATVESRSESRDRMGNTTSASAGTTSRPLQTPDEVLRLDRGRMYLLLDGKRPLLVDRVNYDQNPALAGLWGAVPQPMTPQPVPQVATQPRPAPVASDDDFREVFGKMKAKRDGLS